MVRRRARSHNKPVGKKNVLAWVAIGAAALAAAAALSDFPDKPAPATPVAATAGAKAEPERFASLPAREPIGRARGSLFETQALAPKAAPAKPITVAAAPARPVAPPMPYRVAGKLVRDGTVQVLLSKGEALLTVREGDTVDNQYRVDSIRDDKVTLVYLPLDARHELPVVTALGPPPQAYTQAGALPPSGATEATAERALLRWQGPERVRAGDRFEVTLKVTSSQALRAAPLQISFDASLLEPVAVRAGSFFDGGAFSYRINPAGSIFLGASGKGAPAADAELFVVSFKTIRAALATELRLSALVLQGARGRAIMHERPEVFRTTIVQ